MQHLLDVQRVRGALGGRHFADIMQLPEQLLPPPNRPVKELGVVIRPVLNIPTGGGAKEELASSNFQLLTVDGAMPSASSLTFRR